MIRSLHRHLLVIALAVPLISGCSAFSGEEEVPIEERSALEIFDSAQSQLDSGNAKQAAATFDEVERLYPFSQLAKRATIMSAYANYEAGEFAQARAAASRYLDLYPSDIDAPYAQYLIGLTYYDNIVDVGRDQSTTERALQELTEVVNRYPDSDFARDARLKVDLTHDHLAGKEMTIGRYYLKRGHYAAAANRFRVVIERYQTTSHVPEALHRLVEAYIALGLNGEAQQAGAVLGYNFPGSDWYTDSYALLTGNDLAPADDQDGWLGRTYRQVVKGEWL